MQFRLSVLDVISEASQEDIVLVFSTHKAALWWWPKIMQAMKDTHGEDWITTTKSTIVSKRTQTMIRRWIAVEDLPFSGFNRRFRFVALEDKHSFPAQAWKEIRKYAL